MALDNMLSPSAGKSAAQLTSESQAREPWTHTAGFERRNSQNGTNSKNFLCGLLCYFFATWQNAQPAQIDGDTSRSHGRNARACRADTWPHN